MKIEKAIKQVRLLNRDVRSAPRQKKNLVLSALEGLILSEETGILKANTKDVARATKDKKPTAFIDRLALTPERLALIRESLRQIAALADPIGEVVDERRLANGLMTRRVRSPLGVILVIFESRPNVAIEAFALAFKSGNSAVLRGGKESSETLKIFYHLIHQALKSAGFDPASFYGIVDSDRKLLRDLISRRDLLDIVIPRGGDALIEFVVEYSRVPIIKNDRGLCHLYVHEDADPQMAREILLNGKTQRPGVCNALETLLVHERLAQSLLPELHQALSARNVEWFCCPKSHAILKSQGAKKATKTSFDTEYLDLKLNARVVGSLDEAIAHIEAHGSKHSDSVVTRDQAVARRFQAEVDSAAVYWNASTRFTDGFELGLGGEIGISTQKLHVRGPVGLKELTSPRWVIDGTGQTRK